MTAMLDGIGLQWLLDPSTDVAASVSAYVDRAVAAWRSSEVDGDVSILQGWAGSRPVTIERAE